MIKFLKLFKNVGDFSLIKGNARFHIVFTVISQFVPFDPSKKALEILHLAAQLKAKQKLERIYRCRLVEFEDVPDNATTVLSRSRVVIKDADYKYSV